MAENLWAIREQRKVSVATLANRAGLPIGLILEYESGQRSIDPRHLDRLARALYVDGSDIKLYSDARPGSAPLERHSRSSQAPSEGPAESTKTSPPKGEARPKERGPRPEPRPAGPARPSQLAHLHTLLRQLDISETQLEAEAGKPLAELDRTAMSQLLRSLQEKSREHSSERHRAYLPESVDTFEARYLSEAQRTGATLHFTLFDGRTDAGQVVGFGPYSITVQTPNGEERTLNKLALVSYTKRTVTAEDGDPQS